LLVSLHAGLSAQDFGPILSYLINLCSSPSKPFAEFVLNFGIVGDKAQLTSGPKKTTRPMAQHYIRLLTDIDPATIPDVSPVKSEVIDEDQADGQDTSKLSWLSQQHWYSPCMQF
jgi:hypothetical protein